jgi:hypothetical protein
MGEVPLSRVLGYEDCAWLDVDPKDFAGMSTEERLAELSSFRGPKWAARAAEWLSEGVPPIVVIDAPVVDEAHLYRQIGDGRGRVNFALAMGLKTLPVVIMKWKHPLPRQNPLPLPEGFTTRFGGGVSDDYVPPTISEARRVLRGAQRGDVVTVGRTQWVIKRPVGDVQAYAYKHPSKRTKTYEILLAGTDDDEDEVVVFEVGGSGQQISEVLATGPLRRTGETADLDVSRRNPMHRL